MLPGIRPVLFCLPILLPGGLGCDHPQPSLQPAAKTAAAASGTKYDPSTVGSLVGRVRWSGSFPVVESLVIRSNPLAGGLLRIKHVRPNPNAPQIDPGCHAVTNAVLFLRGIDPARAPPWDHPPVQVDFLGDRIGIRQGGKEWGTGFVRRGDAIAISSREPYFQSVHATGAAYFSLALPDPDQPRTRRLDETGVVELASGAGYYWLRAHLLVGDHPYYTRTDLQGGFTLSHVPPGRYELVCWLPNWRQNRHERDAESGLITRLFFEPPVELVQRIEVKSRESTQTEFVLDESCFETQSPAPTR